MSKFSSLEDMASGPIKDPTIDELRGLFKYVYDIYPEGDNMFKFLKLTNGIILKQFPFSLSCAYLKESSIHGMGVFASKNI